MKPQIVPVTAAHVAQLWGQPAPVTFQGIAVVDGDRVLGIAGVYPDAARYVLVSKISTEGRALLAQGRYVRTLLTAARRMLAIASERSLPVHAVPEPGVDGACNLLRHLGFEPFYKDVWSWAGSR